MQIELADWILNVDVPLTMELSVNQAKEHCDCGYCRNFYAAVDAACPNLRSFLMQFGLAIDGPDELCPFEPTIYEATYIVQGSIVQYGKQNLSIDGIPLYIRSSADSDMCTEHPEPYFTLCIGLMELPWLLEEPMHEVVSPANEEEYLQRMEKKLLIRFDQCELES